MLSLFKRSNDHANRIALSDQKNELSYAALAAQSNKLAHLLLGSKEDLHEERIAFFVDPSPIYTVIQWGIWKAGGIAVPLCVHHPPSALTYVLNDTQCSLLLSEYKHQDFLETFVDQESIDILYLEDVQDPPSLLDLPKVDRSRRAMILYTSGTTNLPKGVVSTHKNIEAQVSTLVEAWKWSFNDHILNVLPLHHVHGIINIMTCALWSGGQCHFLPKFDANEVWNLFAEGDINVFMAVPTIYYKLIACWEAADPQQQQEWSTAARSFRLMVSGSAALPVSVLEKWRKITGHTLLERYGMTEIGMALSNPYNGERRPGHVGQALPGVAIKTVNEYYEEIDPSEQGELLIKGPAVFQEYWNKPQATADAFTKDGWFKTGDVGIFQDGYYRLLGRTSVDIIKSGGYKISALEIEEVIRRYTFVNDCAVVGLDDEEWGQVLACALTSAMQKVNFDDLKKWLSDYLPKYKVPRKYLLVDDLPKNTIGKVTKKEVVKLFAESNDS